ncbi:hypothetical protein [Nocardioides guangzhouensis]|nr:hypothetical protein [Nocardioides guangzhouensis]
MGDERTPDDTPDDGPGAEPDWARRKRLADVFGDVLPETTGDDRAPREPTGDRDDEWLQRQVPPHHG